MTAQQMRTLYERAGLTQEELSAQLGCSRAQLNRYLSEGLPVRMNRLVRANIFKLCEQHGIEIEQREKYQDKMA